MTNPAGPFFVVGNGLRVRIRATPKAARNDIAGLKDVSSGVALAVKVTAVPEGGKANQAVVKLLAKEWKMAKGDFDVISGSAARDKVLAIAGDSDLLSRRLNTWLESLND